MIHLIPPIERPRSPHLQIYRWSITMAMSIAHRLTGISLYFGTIFIVLGLGSLAFSQPSFELFREICGSIFGRVILFFYSFSLIHHMYGGIRHLIWDIKPQWLEKRTASKMSWITLLCSLLSTGFVWILAYKL